MSFLMTARMHANAVVIHSMTKRIVNAEHTPLIPGELSAFPAWIAAKVSPALGKMKA
jgi:hypothetical protein